MLSVSSTRKFFMLAMILGFLFIMGGKAKGADGCNFYEAERASIRNHMMPDNFMQNDRAMDNPSWVEHNTVVR